MHYNKFQIGDKVSYVGSKFNKLNNDVGIVAGRVIGTASGVVVDFSDDSYVVDESHLVRFQGHLKGERDLEIRRNKSRSSDEE